MAHSEHVCVGLLGLTGCGKSTLAKLLRKEGFLHLEEPFSANPFLSRFYASGMKESAFQSQMFFLLRKWALIKGAESLLEFFSIVIDPDIRTDMHMYVDALVRMGAISREEHELYEDTAEALLRGLQPPDLLIYYRVKPETVFTRVKERGREFEETMTLEYLRLQMECLEEWMEGYPGPVVVLDLDEIDITAEEGARFALEKIKIALQLLRKQ